MVLIFFILCIAIANEDKMEHKIPDILTITGICSGLLLNSFCPLGFKGALIGMIFGALLIFISGSINQLLYEKPCLGGGDLKLMAMIGAFWGWEMTLFTFAIAPYLGSIWAAIWNKSRIAYGVFIISSWLIVSCLGLAGCAPDCCYGTAIPLDMKCGGGAYIDCDSNCKHFANCETLVPINQEVINNVGN
jgi:prepilin signal peptidase PulO-like enzyme (type II secretory pathway)